MSTLRPAVEQRSVAPLAVLSRQPRLLVAGVALALLVGTLAGPPALAFPCLLVLLTALAWLSYLSWPLLDGRARGVRVASLGLLLVLGVGAALS